MWNCIRTFFSSSRRCVTTSPTPIWPTRSMGHQKKEKLSPINADFSPWCVIERNMWRRVSLALLPLNNNRTTLWISNHSEENVFSSIHSLKWIMDQFCFQLFSNRFFSLFFLVLQFTYCVYSSSFSSLL